MLKTLLARWKQGCRTNAFPDAPPKLPLHFRGRPEFEANLDLTAAREVCPVNAVRTEHAPHEIDLGRCIFCGKCEKVCPALKFGREYRLGAMSKQALIADGSHPELEEQHSEGLKRLCGKSLKIRQVSAGGCAACELDFNVLGTLAWDMGRFGIQLAASPRHADCILVTGPVSKNMLTALKKTYDAMPKPCFVIASGACAISGGLYADSPEVCGGVDKILPVDLYVPGCPPHPATLLEALVRFMGRKQKENAVKI